MQVRGDTPDNGRRRFLMLMGLACATTAIARPAAALAQPAVPPVAPPPPAEGSPPTPEALALAEVLRLRFGEHLAPEQLRAIAEDLDGRLDSGRELAKLRLANAQEPDTTFHA